MKQRILLTCLLLAFALQGCYFSKQGASLLAQQQRTRDIETLLSSSEISADTREFLLLTQHIRNFAISELGLKSNKNYTGYLELDKNYMVDVVQAAAPLSFEPYTWSYPFLGSMPYKGYFSPEDAQKEKHRLEQKGFDVYVRQVQAFSRLGFFKDPVVSYMKKYSRYRLANVLIHEQVHATLFFKKQNQFNEELAEFLGEVGAIEYLRQHGEPADIEKHQIQSKEYELFKERIFSLKDRLQELYDSPLPDAVKLERKEQIIQEFKHNYKKNYDTLFSTNRFKNIDAVPLNNAYISCFHLYAGHDDLFQQLFQQAEESIPGMLNIVSALDPKEDLYLQIEEYLAQTIGELQ